MNDNNDDRITRKRDHQSGGDSNPFEKRERQEPSFSRYSDDEDETYEEPDRDTDHNSGYREDDVEEDEYDFEEMLSDDSGNNSGQDPEEDDREDASNKFAARSADDDEDLDELWDNSREDDDDLNDDDDEPNDIDDRNMKGRSDEDDDSWIDEEAYANGDDAQQQPWPLGLIAVAIVALLLLVAGGYGVLQQRAAMSDEIRQLRTTLATSPNPGATASGRDDLQETKLRNEELSSELEALTLENRRLTDTVIGLEKQLATQQPAVTTPATASKPAASPKPDPQPAASTNSSPVAAPAAKPPTPQPAPAAAVATGGAWFVNFGSYGREGIARDWQGRLKPIGGKVIIATGSRDGKTFYRLRVVDLKDKASADKVARDLEQRHGVPTLWVGKQ